MAEKTRAQLEALANQIRDETVKKDNTAIRVGDMLLDLIESCFNLEDDSPKQFVTADVTTEVEDETVIDLDALGFVNTRPLNVYIETNLTVGPTDTIIFSLFDGTAFQKDTGISAAGLVNDNVFNFVFDLVGIDMTDVFGAGGSTAGTTTKVQFYQYK